MQYTLRNVPATLDRALRRRARDAGKSLNEVVVDALARGVGLGEESVRVRSVDDIQGSWQEDPEFDEAISDQHRIDEDIWR
jgi:antitoxin FitA-like protein